MHASSLQCADLSLDPTAPPPGPCLTLPEVALGAADDQNLFELNVRLQYSNEERLLLPALGVLAHDVSQDYPAEALLRRQSILVRPGCIQLSVHRCWQSRTIEHVAAGHADEAGVLMVVCVLSCV